MKKIGKNDPCPCGSGKKYKKCCLNKPGPILPVLQEFLTPEEVGDMSTEDIIKRLDGIGIRFDKDVFLRDVEKYYSAQQLSENWFDTFNVTAEGGEEDFPWLAAWVLWAGWRQPRICRAS